MKKNAVKLAAAALLLAAGSAHGAVIYKFEFSQLVRYGSNEALPVPSFGFSLIFEDYLTDTGFNAVIPVDSSATAAIGYDVAYAGLAGTSMWGFDDLAHRAQFVQGGFGYDADSFTFFTGANANYLSTPGTYSGSILGNRAPSRGAFSGTGSVTVIDTSTAIPEPSALALLGAGLAGLGFFRRKQAGRRVRQG